MAAVSPAGPEPTMTTWRASVIGRRRQPSGRESVRWLQATRPMATKTAPTRRSDAHTRPVEDVDGEQPDEGDGEQHHRDQRRGEDEDAEDDDPGGQGQWPHRLVPKERHPAVDQIGGARRPVAEAGASEWGAARARQAAFPCP